MRTRTGAQAFNNFGKPSRLSKSGLRTAYKISPDGVSRNGRLSHSVLAASSSSSRSSP